jgi:hypothetical protein
MGVLNGAEPRSPNTSHSSQSVHVAGDGSGEDAPPTVAAAWLRDRLDAGSLDDHAPVVFTGEKVVDVATYARRELDDLDRPGPIGRAASDHVDRLVAVLRSELEGGPA